MGILTPPLPCVAVQIVEAPDERLNSDQIAKLLALCQAPPAWTLEMGGGFEGGFNVLPVSNDWVAKFEIAWS